MHVLDQVQRRAAPAVEEFDVVAFGLQRVGTAQRVHQPIEFDQARQGERAFVAQQLAHLGQETAHLRVGIAEQGRQHAHALGHRQGGIQSEHGQISALMGMVRFFSLPNRLVSLVPSEQPLPKLKPQPPRTLKVFSAYSRCVVGITKRSS